MAYSMEPNIIVMESRLSQLRVLPKAPHKVSLHVQ